HSVASRDSLSTRVHSSSDGTRTRGGRTFSRKSHAAAPPAAATSSHACHAAMEPNVIVDSRGFAPRTPLQRRSLGASAPRSAPLARSLRSLASPGFAPRTLQRRSLGASAPRSAPLARSLRSLASLGFAPRTPLHALSLAASPARSDRVARSRR